MKDRVVVLNSNTINKYTSSSSGFTSLSILACLCLAGVCFFLFAGQVDSSKIFAYYGSVVLGVFCIALGGYTFIHHLKKEDERNNGEYVIIKDFLTKKQMENKDHCFYFQNYHTCFQGPIIVSKKVFDGIDEKKDCYLLFNNNGNCLSVFECDHTEIDSTVSDNMIYSYSEFLDLED